MKRCKTETATSATEKHFQEGLCFIRQEINSCFSHYLSLCQGKSGKSHFSCVSKDGIVHFGAVYDVPYKVYIL